MKIFARPRLAANTVIEYNSVSFAVQEKQEKQIKIYQEAKYVKSYSFSIAESNHVRKRRLLW